MMNELEEVKAGLQSSYGIQAPAEWLDACIEWIQQENQGGRMGVAELKNMVFEQWLMSDLRELGCSCLPVELPHQPISHVQGPLALQVNSLVDVGFPLYGQLQKVKGSANGNTEVCADKPLQPAWEPKASRMMMLKLTDGQTEVQGMEFSPIPAITPALQLGFKVIVHGLVKCRRGVLMLTAENLQVLGGEVDSLVEGSTPATLLQQAMDASATKGGERLKQEFSGRFINQQGYDQGGCSDKGGMNKCFNSSSAPMARPQPPKWKQEPGPSKQHQGTSFRGPAVKTDQRDVEDEWEEDLDYGGILQTFDEPMEDDEFPDIKPESLPQHVAQPSVLNTNFTSAMPAIKNEPCRQVSPAGVKTEPSSVPVKLESPETFDRDNYSRMSNHNFPRRSIDVPDSMWADEDDFELAQVSTNMSSVIPFQKDLGRKDSFEVDSSTSASTSKTSFSKESGRSGYCDTTFIGSETHSDVKPLLKKPLFSKSPSQSSVSSHFISSSSSQQQGDIKPPPAKQRKLTSMLSTQKRETSQKTSTPPLEKKPSSTIMTSWLSSQIKNGSVNQNKNSSCDPVVDLTDEEAESNVNSKSVKIENVVECAPSGSMRVVTSSQEISYEETQTDSQASFCQGSKEEAASIEHQYLQDVINWLKSSSQEQGNYVIKGHISTLTSALRSGKGDCWSLCCRVRDKTGDLEVAIDNEVLCHLIGFTAKESISMREKARKDPALKNTMTEGLRSCQRALIEFSGLITLSKGKDASKPLVTKMLQLEKKKRQ